MNYGYQGGQMGGQMGQMGQMGGPFAPSAPSPPPSFSMIQNAGMPQLDAQRNYIVEHEKNSTKLFGFKVQEDKRYAKLDPNARTKVKVTFLKMRYMCWSKDEYTRAVFRKIGKVLLIILVGMAIFLYFLNTLIYATVDNTRNLAIMCHSEDDYGRTQLDKSFFSCCKYVKDYSCELYEPNMKDVDKLGQSLMCGLFFLEFTRDYLCRATKKPSEKKKEEEELPPLYYRGGTKL